MLSNYLIIRRSGYTYTVLLFYSYYMHGSVLPN